MTRTPSDELRRGVELLLDTWLTRQLDQNPAVLGIEHGEPDEHLWIARLAGEVKERFAVRFVVDQRTLRAETYVLPTPTRNAAEVYELVLRANVDLYGVSFEVGDDTGLYLAGRLHLDWVDDAELDRLLGTLYTATERYFPRLVRLSFGLHPTVE